MAMESGNIDVMRNTIQQYICQYGQDWSRFRDVRIQLVDGNTYAQLSAVDLIQQLHCVITLGVQGYCVENGEQRSIPRVR